MSLIDDGSAPTSRQEVRTPALSLFLTEPIRGVLSFATLPLAAPLLARAPRGDGHAVLVVPGLLADDLSTRPLRHLLKMLGYDVHGWGLGRNVGPTSAIVAGLPSALDNLARTSGLTVSVIGWSLGGILARELARNHPETVRQVITLASPYAMVNDRQSRADNAFRRHSHRHVTSGVPTREQIREPIPVPSTAVFSRTDGIVDWRACIEPTTHQHENVAVRAGHLGIGFDAAVMWVLADRLAQTPGEWQPFRPPALLGALFPDPA